MLLEVSWGEVRADAQNWYMVPTDAGKDPPSTQDDTTSI